MNCIKRPIRPFPSVKVIGQVHHEGELLPTAQVITVNHDDEKSSKDSKTPSVAEVTAELAHEDFVEVVELADPADVKRAFWWSAVIIIIVAVIIPIPLGSVSYVYSPGFFTAWMVVAMVRSLFPYRFLKKKC